MSGTSVFDVATALIARSGRTTMSTVKLQKLCFYTFGWYAHLTGESLFSEQFYAMEKGPVVGELLSAHAGSRTVTHSTLLEQLAERDGFKDDLGPYVERLVDAVWECYGRESAWDLVELTHAEEVWRRAWDGRPSGSKRADLPQVGIVEHFLGRSPDVGLHLPPSVISYLSDEDAEAVKSQTGCPDFVSAVRAFRQAS